MAGPTLRSMHGKIIIGKLQGFVESGGLLYGFLILILPCAIFIRYAVKRRRFIRNLSWIPGFSGFPLLGNSLSLMGGQVEFFRLLVNLSTKYGPIFKLWIGTRPFVFISGVEYVQPILGSNLHLDKSREYKFLDPWLGSGLLTSTGPKWHQRRKMLTPTFHYSVLEEFIEPIVEQSRVLVECLSKKVNQPEFNVMGFTKLCALDIICVTSMGKCVSAQLNEDHRYVKAVAGLSEILQRRFITPWLKPEFIFDKTPMGKLQREYINVINGFVNGIIQEKKLSKEISSFQSFEKKRKNRVFIDLIMEVAQNEEMLTDKEIRDEVNTFMFAGHDTTSVAIAWCLYVLGKHPDVQEKILEEYTATVKNEIPKFSELQKLQYFESCIREVLRLYPVVPLLARDIKSDILLGENQKIASGVTALIFTPALHRNPEYFSSPDDFVPERFMNKNREFENPFAYIPFSAGPRNCIGAKFAMLELKIVLHEVLKNYVVSSLHMEEELKLYTEIVLLNEGGIQIQLQKRT